MGRRAALLAVAVVALGLSLPDRCSAKFVNALILDEAVAESCSADSTEPHPSKPGLPSAVPVSPGTKRCVHARLDRARYLRSNGHLKAALKDFKACKDLLPEEFQLMKKSPEAREFQSLSTAIAMQREGRRLYAEAEELVQQDRSGALMLYQQSISTLKRAAHYLVTLRSTKNDANARSLTDLAELAEKQTKALALEV